MTGDADPAMLLPRDTGDVVPKSPAIYQIKRNEECTFKSALVKRLFQNLVKVIGPKSDNKAMEVKSLGRPSRFR